MSPIQKNKQMEDQFDDNDWYNGSIKSITLENFMCHSHFHLTFNPRINFISGLNGSGKSAIQAAIVIGLGGTAAIVNRGKSVQSLIKYGCSSASISITLANGGDCNYDSGPYKPEIYGKQITVVRNITASSSTYKFLNENGRVIKSNKKELKNLLLHFNIMPDNPVCVMNQGDVKIFHKNTKDNEKFELFYKASSANIYSDQIDATKIIANEYAEKLQKAEEILDQCHKEMKEYETYEKKSKQLELLKKSIGHFQNEYAWQIVNKIEKECNDNTNEMSNCKEYICQSKSSIKELEEKVKQSSDILKEKQEELSIAQEARSRNHFALMDIKKEKQNKICEYDKIKQSIRSYDSNLKMFLNDKKELEKHIAIENQKGNSNNVAQLTESINRLEQNIKDIEAAWKNNIEYEQILNNTIDDLRQKIGHLKNNEIAPLQRRVAELNKNINSMSQQQDRINFYGNWMPNLIIAIETAYKQKKFIKKPIGPIGAHIKVNSDKWIFSIENFLGRGSLRTFLVDNFTDNKTLQSIMDKIIPGGTRKPTVVTSKFFDQVHNIMEKETKSSLFRMLTFTNPVVANSLIDNNRIETIMLVEDAGEAMPMMENVSKVPKNCQFSLTLDGTQIYPSPSYRVYSLQNPTEAVLLQSDVSVAINNLKQEKKELEAKITNLLGESENLEYSKNEKQQNLNKTRSETRLLKSKYDEYTKKANELKAKCDEEQDDRLNTLTEEMNEVNSKIANIEKLRENSIAPLSCIEKEITEINVRMRELQSTIEKTDRSAIMEQIENHESKIKNYKSEISQINNEVKNKILFLNKLEIKSVSIKKDLVKKEEEARCLCEKIVTTRDEEDIRRDIEDTNHKFQLLELELKKKKDNHLGLRDDYKKKKKEYLQHNSLLNQIKEIYFNNKKSIESSDLFLQNYLEVVRLKVIESFDLILLLRKIKGNLEIDLKERTMHISMFDNISTSCASGGERTFATVALILSLWSNVQLPFYSIDEYDVYMDNINRMATTSLLMMSIENRRNQFIFLTPQDISHIHSANNIKVVRLKEPRS
ncbi:structural maintenance of chromosomes protein 6 [Daktulosphaira vitifoliae]|uniref:structural maintenance of chromosomes protein 6 n=1 Tax=Daktulosphaira vitifoliae TaxID=58002 RepID=UPI0021AA3B17|nr:structural maintenance of chromosomes protein 6 [Daktulosphaira vitifoliae]